MKRFVVCRFNWGWCVWDNHHSRFSDGIYTNREMAVEQAQFQNEDPEAGDRDWFAGETFKGTRRSRRTYFDDYVEEK